MGLEPNGKKGNQDTPMRRSLERERERESAGNRQGKGGMARAQSGGDGVSERKHTERAQRNREGREGSCGGRVR